MKLLTDLISRPLQNAIPYILVDVCNCVQMCAIVCNCVQMCAVCYGQKSCVLVIFQVCNQVWSVKC